MSSDPEHLHLDHWKISGYIGRATALNTEKKPISTNGAPFSSEPASPLPVETELYHQVLPCQSDMKWP
jgi:hypothetical protein